MIKTAATFPPSAGQNHEGSISRMVLEGRAGLQPHCAVEQGIPQSLRSCSFAGFFSMLHDTVHPKEVNPKFPAPGHYKWCLYLPALRKLFFISLFITHFKIYNRKIQKQVPQAFNLIFLNKISCPESVYRKHCQDNSILYTFCFKNILPRIYVLKFWLIFF